MLVAAGDSDALADGALAVLAGHVRDEIAVNAKADVARYYNPREASQRVEDIYLEALAAPVSPLGSLAVVAANKLLRRILAAPSTRAWRSILRSETPSEERYRLALKILVSKMRRPLRRAYER